MVNIAWLSRGGRESSVTTRWCDGGRTSRRHQVGAKHRALGNEQASLSNIAVASVLRCCASGELLVLLFSFRARRVHSRRCCAASAFIFIKTVLDVGGGGGALLNGRRWWRAWATRGASKSIDSSPSSPLSRSSACALHEKPRLGTHNAVRPRRCIVVFFVACVFASRFSPRTTFFRRARLLRASHFRAKTALWLYRGHQT